MVYITTCFANSSNLMQMEMFLQLVLIAEGVFQFLQNEVKEFFGSEDVQHKLYLRLSI